MSLDCDLIKKGEGGSVIFRDSNYFETAHISCFSTCEQCQLARRARYIKRKVLRKIGDPCQRL